MNMYIIFSGSYSFQGEGLSSWKAISVTDMHSMLHGTFKFQGESLSS